MNSCEVKIVDWNTKLCRSRRSSEVAEVTPPSLARTSDFIYITLAKESPIRVFESDEDFYNSFNEQETDVCHDSSDLSGSDTDSQCSSISHRSLNHESLNTIATMEVLEYEVASATESENDFSGVSSSGTDDYVLAAVAQAVADNSSATEFAILADTEESDDQSNDSDFAPADYWKCVKCNNKQNNPMYRYCERCYQVRKSFFPPRPKQKRKSRFKNVVKDGELSDSSTSSSSKSVESDSSINRLSLEPYKCYGKPTISRQSSMTKISDSDSGNEIVVNQTTTCRSQKDSYANNTTSKESTHQGILERTSLASSIIKNNKRRISDESLSYESVCLKKRCNSEVLLPEVIDIKNKRLQLDVFKDSGFSSSSSQERTPTEDKLEFEESFSQETIESNRTTRHAVRKCDSNEALPLSTPELSSRYSTLSQVSCESTGSAYFRHEPQSLDCSAFFAKSENNLGLCMFCLSEPKNSVFVHSNFVHLCCCYKCAMKIWKQRKSCPICNCKVKNVMKLFVH